MEKLSCASGETRRAKNAAGEFELRYALKAKIKGLEVIAADDNHPVNYVCRQGDEIRAFVREKDSGWREADGDRKWEEEVWRWHSVVNNKLGEIADQPEKCAILDAQEDMPEDMREERPRLEGGLWKIKSGRHFVRAGKWKDQQGLWLCALGQEPKLIAEGDYSWPIVTPDGNHLVVVRGPHPGELVRIDIRKKRATKVETDDSHYLITLAPGSGKIYFQRFRGGRAEHVLLDPASGRIEVAQGEFEPLIHQNLRPLQPVAGSREYWAAIPDSEKRLTRVGRYDARAFSFKPLMEIPEIYITSDEMWVDEAAQRIYLAYHGHLLRLPLMLNPKSSGK